MWRVWVRTGAVGKPEGKRPMGRPRRRWVDNIRMGLQKVGCGYMDWIGLPQDRDSWQTLVSAVMNLRVQWNAGNFLTSCKPVSFSRRTLHHGVSKIYYTIFIIYYSSDSPSSLITESLSVTRSLNISYGPFAPLAVKWPLHTRRVSRITVKALVTSNIIQSICLVGKRRLKDRCGLEPRTNFFFSFNKSAKTCAD